MNTTTNTVSEIHTSDSDQWHRYRQNYSNSMGWNNLPDMIMTSKNSDINDTDETEWLKRVP